MQTSPAPVRFVSRHAGQALVEVVISVGITGILIAAMAVMFTNGQRETQALNEKLASTDLERMLTNSLADGTVCQYILNNPAILTFDSTAVSPSTPQYVTPTLPIYASISAGPPVSFGPVVAQVGSRAAPNSNTAVIKTVSLAVTNPPSPMPPPGPGAIFTGMWLVTLDATKMVRNLKPIAVSTRLIVDTTTPTAAKVTACQLGSGGGGGGTGFTACTTVVGTATAANCPAGYTLSGVGYDNGGGGGQLRVVRPNGNSAECSGTSGTAACYAICCH